MKRIVRSTLAIGATAACTVGIAVAAQASNGDKILICHGTVSDPNPWVMISVDASALAGHFDGSAPGHGPNNHPDFFPATGQTDCSTGPGPE